jgi:hypothetical protein
MAAHGLCHTIPYNQVSSFFYQLSALLHRTTNSERFWISLNISETLRTSPHQIVDQSSSSRRRMTIWSTYE